MGGEHLDDEDMDRIIQGLIALAQSPTPEVLEAYKRYPPRDFRDPNQLGKLNIVAMRGQKDGTNG